MLMYSVSGTQHGVCAQWWHEAFARAAPQYSVGFTWPSTLKVRLESPLRGSVDCTKYPLMT